VQSGDTLSTIAAKEGVSDWHTLYTENESTVGSNPNLIYPGQVLNLG
jgi:nucleoid-associated protein YgaU